MVKVRNDTLEQALHRIFEGGSSTDASWFALTGGEPLFNAGDPADMLYLLRAGRLGVFHHEEDQPPQFVGVIRPGEPAGEMAMLAGTPHTAGVVALRDSEILALPREAFFRAARTEPDLMVELSRLMIHRARNRATGGGEPSVFGFIGVRPRPIRAFVERIAAAVEALGFTCQVIDHSALSSAAEWFSRVEDTHDFVLYVAEQDEPAWANLCARQVDRLFIVGSALLVPPRGKMPHSHALDAQQRTDLILLRDRRMSRPANSAVWLDAINPGRWFHATEGDPDDAARMARIITGTAVGLVLSGGGARAYSHIGVLRALTEAKVPLDFLGGSSMGAVVAAGPALGWSQEELEDHIRQAFVKSDPLSDITFPLIAMTRSGKVGRLLKEAYGEIDIADTERPFFLVSTNLTSGGDRDPSARPVAPGHARIDRHSGRHAASGDQRPGPGRRGGAEELPNRSDAPDPLWPHHRGRHVPGQGRGRRDPGKPAVLVEMDHFGCVETGAADRGDPDALGDPDDRC